MPIEVYQSKGAAGFAPGVTVALLLSYSPAGRNSADPSVPPADHYRLGPQNTAVPSAPLWGFAATINTGIGVFYDATIGREVFRAGNGPCTVFARTHIACPIAGPWRVPYPGIPEPSAAVCGWTTTLRFQANPAIVSSGFGWVIKPVVTGGGAVFTGGGLPPDPTDDMAITGECAYVALYRPSGLNGQLSVRVRGNDGTVRLYPLLISGIDPLQYFTADWRVYRATASQCARYELYLNGLLAWQQFMNEGPGSNGDHSASPFAAGQAIIPMFWRQQDPGIGVGARAGFVSLDHACYTGYDDAATTDRGE